MEFIWLIIIFLVGYFLIGIKRASRKSNLASPTELLELNDLICHFSTENHEYILEIVNTMAYAVQTYTSTGLLSDPTPMEDRLNIDSIIIQKIMIESCHNNGINVRQLREAVNELGYSTLQIGNSIKRLVKAEIIIELGGNFSITSKICNLIINELKKIS